LRVIVGVLIVTEVELPGLSVTLPLTVPWFVMETVGVPAKATANV